MARVRWRELTSEEVQKARRDGKQVFKRTVPGGVYENDPDFTSWCVLEIKEDFWHEVEETE